MLRMRGLLFLALSCNVFRESLSLDTILGYDNSATLLLRQPKTGNLSTSGAKVLNSFADTILKDKSEPTFSEVESSSRFIADKIVRNVEKMGNSRLLIGVSDLTFQDDEAIERESLPSPSNTDRPQSVFARKRAQRARRLASDILRVDKLKTEKLVRGMEVQPNLGLVVLEMDPSLSSEMLSQTVKSLWRTNESIWLVEADDEVQLRDTPNDTHFGRQWALSDSNKHDIRAIEAWQVLKNENLSPVIVAHIDSGIDISHPEFADRLYVNKDEIPDNGIDDDNNGYIDDVSGWNFANNSGTIIDYSTHGTHTAGTVVAKSNNSYAMSGVVPNEITLLPLAFRNLASEAIAAIDYSLAMGAKISTNSWGFNSPVESLRVALQRSAVYGQLFVCAVDNRGRNNGSFSDFPPNWGQMGSSTGMTHILRVANYSESGRIANTSNYGGSTVDIAAPGENIVSTIPLREGATLAFKSGTSMATPHVAGVAAVVAAINPNLSAAEIRTLLMETARKTDRLAGKVISNGALDYHAAVVAAITSRDGNFIPPSSTTTSKPAPTTTTTRTPTITTTTTEDPVETTTAAPLLSQYNKWLSDLQYFPKYFSWGNKGGARKDETEKPQGKRPRRGDLDFADGFEYDQDDLNHEPYNDYAAEWKDEFLDSESDEHFLYNSR